MMCMPCAVYNLNFSASGRLLSYGRQGCILVACLMNNSLLFLGLRWEINLSWEVGLRREVCNRSKRIAATLSKININKHWSSWLWMCVFCNSSKIDSHHLDSEFVQTFSSSLFVEPQPAEMKGLTFIKIGLGEGIYPSCLWVKGWVHSWETWESQHM